MKFTISCSDLKAGMQQVINVIPSKTTLPILNHVLIEAKDGRLTFSATDLEISLNTSVNATVEEDGAITIPGKLLYDVIREIPDIPINITTDDSNRILFKYSRGEYTFYGEDAKDFPKLPAIDVKNEVTFAKSKFKRLIDKTSFAVSNDELRAALMGVLFQIREDKCIAVSTDGHRLARIIDTGFTATTAADDMIVPVKALHLISKNLEGEGDLKISFAENHIVIITDSVTISVTLIDGKYPDYEKVIPANDTKKMVLNRAELVSSLRTVSVLANKITQQVKLQISSNKVVITSQDMDRGEGHETIECDYNGEDMEIGFNSAYIVDVLKHIDTENVEFKLDTSTSATLIFPEKQNENEDLLTLVMPIKLRD